MCSTVNNVKPYGGSTVKRRKITALTVALAVCLIAGAAVAPANANFVMVDKNPYGGTAIKAPGLKEIILTVYNGAKVKTYSMANLLALKSSTISIYEPFVQKQQKFTVIPLAYFFTASSISAKMKVDTIALNDYIYTNTAKNFTDAKAYLAFQLAGKPIGYDQGGPIRIIFPTDSKWSKFLDPWNWSLRDIAVKRTG